MSATLAFRANGAATTPGRLVRAAAVIAVLAALAAGASLWAAHSIEDAARTVGRDAEPSVALALRMAATLEDMDASAVADALTDNGAATGASAKFREDMRVLTSDIVAAARNITYGEAEAGPLRGLLAKLDLFEEAVFDARFMGQGDPWITSRRVQWASRVARDMAAPEALALAAANADELERRYASYRETSVIYGGAAFGAFALLVAFQLGVQAWLAARMRRLVNPPLAAATLVSAACGLWLGAAILTERADLRAAKSDAYDSLHVLFQAKAAAAALRADASLWLLDPTARADAQARMDAAARALIGVDLSKPDKTYALLEALGRAQALERAGSPAEALAQAPHPGGLLGAELDNITFGPPERDAASDSVARLSDAEAAVRAAQTQEQRGAHVTAVSRWLDQGGGTGAFAALDAALDRAVAVNQSEFDRRVGSAIGRAGLIPLAACGGLALSALLSAGGLWLRLREYR